MTVFTTYIYNQASSFFRSLSDNIVDGVSSFRLSNMELLALTFGKKKYFAYCSDINYFFFKVWSFDVICLST